MDFKISIIIPTFNSEKFILNALKSLLQQTTNMNIEVLVIDDFSTDNTVAVVKEFMKEHEKINLLINIREKGASGARNTGLIKATGDYIAFLDADDLWLPNHLKEAMNFYMCHFSRADIIFFNFNIYEYKVRRLVWDWFGIRKYPRAFKTKDLPGGYELIDDDVVKALLEESFIHLQSSVLKRSIVDGIYFNESVQRSGEDRDFFIQLATQKNAKFAYKEVITSVYNLHNNSLTAKSMNNSLSIIQDHIFLFENYLAQKWAKDKKYLIEIRKLLFERYLMASYYFIKLDNPLIALKYLLKSFRYKFSV